jgi:hypothetical protein
MEKRFLSLLMTESRSSGNVIFKLLRARVFSWRLLGHFCKEIRVCAWRRSRMFVDKSISPSDTCAKLRSSL